MTARTRIGWIKFKECEKLNGRKILLDVKKRIYRSCVKSKMLYGSEIWCLQKEMAILKRTEKALTKAMCGVKFN